MSGTPRGGIQTWKSLIKYVKSPLNADLALLYGDKFNMPDFLLGQAEHNWIFEEPKNWKNFYIDRFEDQTALNFLLKGEKYGMAGGIDNFSGSGAIVSGFKIIINESYLDIISKYKYIIHSRFDQYYVDYHPEFNGDKIWIPKGEDYFGIFDRHAVFPASMSEKYFNIASYLGDKKSYKNFRYKVSPESVFLGNLEFHNLQKSIERVDRFQFTSSTKHDTTRWRKAIYKLHLTGGIMIKYPDEFIESIKNSVNKNGMNYIFNHPVLCMNYYYLCLRRYLGKIKKNMKKIMT